MAEIRLVRTRTTKLQKGLVTDQDIDSVKEAIAEEMWEWFDAHKDDVLTTQKVWFFTVTLKVHHAEPLFTILFGERA